jgi:hypothetical protein
MGWDDLSDAGGGMGGPFLGGLGGGAMMSGGLGGLDSPDAMMGDMWGGMGSGMGGLYPPAMMGMPLGYSPWMHGDPMGVFSGSVLGEDDDSGVWDAEEDAEGSDPFELYYRAMKKSQMKNKGKQHPGHGAQQNHLWPNADPDFLTLVLTLPQAHAGSAGRQVCSERHKMHTCQCVRIPVVLSALVAIMNER